MIFLGADIGTTRIKALAYSATETRVIATVERATSVETTAHGAAHDADKIYAAVLECLVDLVAQLPPRQQVAAISVASLGEEVVLVDAEGTALVPTPTWYESPGKAYADQFPTPINPTYSALLLRWFSEQHPQQSAAAAAFTDVGSYVISRLSGRGAALVMDHSHASRTGFFDVDTRSFTTSALDWAGEWRPKAPRLVPSGSVIGELAAEAQSRLGLTGSIAVVAGAHDHFAAAFASGVRGPGDAMLSAGTSEALLLLTDSAALEPPDDVDLGAFVDDHTAYLHRNIRAGHLFAQWRELLHLTTPTSAWFVPETWPAGTDAFTLALLDGSKSTATLRNIPFAVEPSEIMRSLSEGLAVNARAMLADVESAAGHPARTLTVAGPSGEQDAWLRMRAAIFDRPLRVVRTAEPTALGAALLAQRGVTGRADTPVPVHVVEPPTDAAARSYYDRLLRAYAHAARPDPALPARP